MAFKIISKQQKTSQQTVVFYEPGDHKESTRYDFDVTFKILSTSEFMDLTHSQENDTESEGQDHDFEVMRQVVTNIEGLLDEDGHPIAYSEDILSLVLDNVYAKPALVKAFFALHTKAGRKSTRVKN